MPYIVHYRDDRQDKPQIYEEETTRTMIDLHFKDPIVSESRWEDFQCGIRVYVEELGYIEKANTEEDPCESNT